MYWLEAQWGERKSREIWGWLSISQSLSWCSLQWLLISPFLLFPSLCFYHINTSYTYKHYYRHQSHSTHRHTHPHTPAHTHTKHFCLNADICIVAIPIQPMPVSVSKTTSQSVSCGFAANSIADDMMWVCVINYFLKCAFCSLLYEILKIRSRSRLKIDF